MAFEFGLISPLYNLAKDGLKWILRKFARPDPNEIARARTQWKDEFEKHLKWIDDVVGYGEMIVRDVKRINHYPDLDPKAKGISPWFRVGLLGLYHRGVEVGLAIEAVKQLPGGEWMLTQDFANKTANAYVVGRIPFEWITSVDWSGDEYYYKPNLYCQFLGKRGEPYEEVLLCSKNLGMGRPYYSKLTIYTEAKRRRERIEGRE